MDAWERALLKVEHGFKPMEQEAVRLFATQTHQNAKRRAIQLLASKHYQLRSVGVFLLGALSAKDTAALMVLREQVSADSSWQVQEILAKAFDRFCSDIGYGSALSFIRDWLSDPRPNVSRAVVEGLRIWTSRPYFKENPAVAIELISMNKDRDGDYLLRSVGNALRDVAKRHPELVKAETKGWDRTDVRLQLVLKLIYGKSKS